MLFICECERLLLVVDRPTDLFLTISLLKNLWVSLVWMVCCHKYKIDLCFFKKKLTQGMLELLQCKCWVNLRAEGTPFYFIINTSDAPSKSWGCFCLPVRTFSAWINPTQAHQFSSLSPAATGGISPDLSLTSSFLRLPVRQPSTSGYDCNMVVAYVPAHCLALSLSPLKRVYLSFLVNCFCVLTWETKL